MRKLTCEMCGSIDLIKHDGVFICQYCGCKYSIEEAKRMMIEGSIDVSGSTVKIDNTAFVEKYLLNARRAKQKEDWEETEKYYNMVEQNDPTNIEAIFYSAYGKAKQSLVKADIFERQAAFQVLQNSISIIDDNFDITKEQEQKVIIQQISNDLISMATSNYVYNLKKNGYGIEIWNDKPQTVTLFNNLGFEFCTTLESIAYKYPEDLKQHRLFFYHLSLKHASFILQNGKVPSPGILSNRIMGYHRLINEIDPSHQIPINAPAAHSGGCYIATAVYGSYDCPQVWTLRRFRDNKLAETWYGRLLIYIYYTVSPTLVKWFGQTEWFKRIWKGNLDRMVANLNADGVEDTHYEDKIW